MGRFSVEPEEGHATPETQELCDGSLLSLIPFSIFEHRVGEVTLGQGVYICVQTHLHVSCLREGMFATSSVPVELGDVGSEWL